MVTGFPFYANYLSAVQTSAKARPYSPRTRSNPTACTRLDPIAPTSGAYAGGLSIRDAAFAGMFARAPLVGAIGSKRVHAVGFEWVRGSRTAVG